MTDTDPALRDALARIPRPWDPEDMSATLAALHAVLERFPDHPLALAEVGGGYDTAGDEASAVGYYEGEDLRRVLLQYGSTLKNLGRLDDSLRVLEDARARFPGSESLRAFHALSLHAAGRSDAAVAELLLLAADAVPTADLQRYQRSIRGYAAELTDGPAT
jgi:hypothetical protein